MADIKEKIIPPQREGGKKDIEEKITANDINGSRKIFSIGRNRLLDVNKWQELAGKALSKFTLVDTEGNEVMRTAEKGDYIKIDLPAPGNSEGDGFDWVYIEEIEENKSSEEKESVAMRVRPASPPQKGEKVAHFFKDKATSTFLIERDGLHVTAGEFGRNEIPNVDAEKVIDKIRNAVVGASAIAGGSNIQWKALVKGFISTDEH